MFKGYVFTITEFQSTAPSQRLTQTALGPVSWYLISIHSPIAEADGQFRPYRHYDDISIHSPIAEADRGVAILGGKQSISIHSPIAEADSKYTYIFHILLIFFIKLYHIPLLYTSHPPIDSHFHQNIN